MAAGERRGAQRARRGTPREEGAAVPASEPAPVELAIDGTLDLHAFRPAEVGDLVPEWLAACRERGILEVRIVHGKGTGALRRSVEAILARSPLVSSSRAAEEGAGGWGATLATLRPAGLPPAAPRSSPAEPGSERP